MFCMVSLDPELFKLFNISLIRGTTWANKLKSKNWKPCFSNLSKKLTILIDFYLKIRNCLTIDCQNNRPPREHEGAGGREKNCDDGPTYSPTSVGAGAGDDDEGRQCR